MEKDDRLKKKLKRGEEQNGGAVSVEDNQLGPSTVGNFEVKTASNFRGKFFSPIL